MAGWPTILTAYGSGSAGPFITFGYYGEDDEGVDPMPANTVQENTVTLTASTATQMDSTANGGGAVPPTRYRVRLINWDPTNQVMVAASSSAVSAGNVDYVDSNGGVWEDYLTSNVQVWVYSAGASVVHIKQYAT